MQEMAQQQRLLVGKKKEVDATLVKSEQWTKTTLSQSNKN